MTNSKHLPKRRFKEFELDGEWEETKLRELFQYIGNAFVGTATPYYVESGHFYLESNNIKDGQINYNTEVFINDEFYQKQKNKWLQTGDMVMVQSGHVGHAAVIPENLNNSAAHALIMFRNPSENLESHFLNYQYQTTKAKEKIKTITTGNTIQHILASDMKEYKVYISNIKEQLKIGKFFQTIDSLITLHQHKLDKLKNLKKAYLSEMFPAEGERVPKRRFPGFEGEWEQDLLGNIVDFSIKTNSFSRENLTHKSYEVKNIHYGDILVKFQSVLDLKQDNLPSIINSSVLD
ncbi:restriction endonuclease subunit S, partial [Streptococcus thermophilus]